MTVLLDERILFEVSTNGRHYIIATDHLTTVRLWIKVRDEDSILPFSLDLVPLINANSEVNDDDPWETCTGFYWKFLDYKSHLFPQEVRNQIDKYFKLKAFW